MLRTTNIRKSLGFSLIELMIAITAGLIVTGAVTVFAVSTGKSTSANIRATRVAQDMRSALNLIEREIRRSGFDERAINWVGSCQSVTGTCPLSAFTSVVISNPSCIIVSYDSASNASPGTRGAGQYHGFRLKPNTRPGVVQANLTENPPDCSSASSAWQDVTNSDVSDITALSFTDLSTVTSTDPDWIKSGGCVRSSIGLYAYVQDVGVMMTGKWIDGSVVTSRTLKEAVRVRNDRVSTTNPGGCA